MTVFTFTNPKGGSSKSTSALILATTLAQFGQRVALIDSDRNAPLMKWWASRQKLGLKTENLTVLAAFDKEVMREIDVLKQDHAYVIVDTEGTANITVAYALARTDLAILPISISQLDVDQAGKAIDFIEGQSDAYKRSIPYRLLFTRTNPAFQTRIERAIRRDAEEDKVIYFATTLMLRQAYIELFARNATLPELLNKEISTIDKAIENATTFAREVVFISNAIVRGEPGAVWQPPQNAVAA